MRPLSLANLQVDCKLQECKTISISRQLAIELSPAVQQGNVSAVVQAPGAGREDVQSRF